MKQRDFLFYPYSPVALLQARWGEVIQNGIATIFAAQTAITSKRNILLAGERAEEINLVLPMKNGDKITFKAKCKPELLNDPQIEDLAIFSNGDELTSLVGHFSFTDIDAWKGRWTKNKLHVVGVSPKHEIVNELLEPKILEDGFLQYETSFGDDHAGSPLLFRIDPTCEEWTLLGIHAFSKNGRGFGWPFSLDSTTEIHIRDSYLEEIENQELAKLGLSRKPK